MWLIEPTAKYAAWLPGKVYEQKQQEIGDPPAES